MAFSRSNVEVPMDLVADILLNLPVKSIIRFKCVAKTWYNLFQTPTFVSQHLMVTKRKKSLVIKYEDPNDHLRDNCGLLMFDDKGTFVSCHDLSDEFPLPASSCTDERQILECITVGDGLVCLYYWPCYEMILWNPATKELRSLPDINQCIPHDQSESSLEYISFGANPSLGYMGCGIDPLSNDYKVLFIRKYVADDLKTQCAIYNLSKDCWSELKVDNWVDEY